MRRDWTENDTPVDHTRIADRGKDTPFQLVTRQLTIALEGPMANVKNFLGKLHGMDRFMHTKSISLMRGSSGMTELDIDILLFELVPKSDT
jgi:hypothetical protein